MNPFVVPNDWSIVDVHSYNVLFVISGSTNLSSVVRMINAITHGGEPAPSPSPSPNSPAAASGSIMLINPDAREAEGIEEVPVAPAQGSDSARAVQGDAADAGAGSGSGSGSDESLPSDAGR